MAQQGIADLPLPGTRSAPKTFKGKHSDVESFLYFFNRLCTKHHITSDADKIESFVHYCSRTVRETLEGLRSYRDKNWDAFARDFTKYYEAERDKKRFKLADLMRYIQTTEKKKIKDLAAWMKYRRGFVRIAGWLQQRSKITINDYETYLWLGIPPRFRGMLEARLMAQKPNHDLEKPFAEDDVCKAAESLLRRDRFDTERIPLDTGEDSSSEPDESDSDPSNDEDSDSESDVVRKKSHRRHSSSHAHKRRDTKKRLVIERKSVSPASDSDSDAPSRSHRRQARKEEETKAKQDKELEELVDQLSRMSVDDTRYAVIYFKAYTINPAIKEIIPTPKEQRESSSRTHHG